MEFSLVSNLHLLNDVILTFLKEHMVSVSTSIGGPEDLHNQNQSHCQGDGTYTFLNSDRYIGTFSGDRMCDGTYTFSTGQTLKGHFERVIPSGKMICMTYGIAYNTTQHNGAYVGITIA